MSDKKRKSHPEIFLLLNVGVSPKTLIERYGFSKATVYKYGRELKEAKKLIEKLANLE